MELRDLPAAQQHHVPAIITRSPERRAHTQRFLSARLQLSVSNPRMTTAEASRLALEAAGDAPRALWLCLHLCLLVSVFVLPIPCPMLHCSLAATQFLTP